MYSRLGINPLDWPIVLHVDDARFADSRFFEPMTRLSQPAVDRKGRESVTSAVPARLDPGMWLMTTIGFF